MSCLIFIFSVTFSLLYTLCKCLTNVANAGIQLYSQSNSISTYPVCFQYFLIPVSPSFLATSRSTLFFAHIYFLTRSTRFDIQATSADAIVSAIHFDSLSFFLTFSSLITSSIAIILVWRILYCQICKSYSFLFILL